MSSPLLSPSHVIPVEIISLIIHESSDSDSTLHAWSLVSLGCLSIAGPLLNEHVQISSNSVLSRVLQRITLDGDDPLLLPFPRLLLPLSLKNVKRLTFLIQPDVLIVESLTEGRSLNSYRRRQLVLDFHAQCVGKEDAFVFVTFLLPRLVDLLTPLQLYFRLNHEDHVNLNSCALEGYLSAIALIPHTPLKDLPAYHETNRPTVEQGLLARALVATHQLQQATARFRANLDVVVGPFTILCNLEKCPKSLREGALEDLHAMRRRFAEEEEIGREELERKRIERRWETVDEVLRSVENKCTGQTNRYTDLLTNLLKSTSEALNTSHVDS